MVRASFCVRHEKLKKSRVVVVLSVV
jgi:hypothetical protein